MIHSRVKIILELEVDLDIVPGVFHQAEDWVQLATREFLHQKHYNAVLVSSKIEAVEKLVCPLHIMN